MGRQLFDWVAALLMLRLLVAVLCALAVQRLLSWLQRVLGASEASADRRVLNAAWTRNHREQHTGVRRVRRREAADSAVPLGQSSN